MAVKKKKDKKATRPHKHPAALIKYVKDLVKELQVLLRLDEFKINVKPIERDEADKNGALEMASVSIDTVYLVVTIYIRPSLRDLWEEKKYNDVCETIIHEMIHIFIEPVWAEAKMYCPGGENNRVLTDVVERQTQRLAQSLRNILPHDFHEPSKRKTQ